ncbi:hypothetical protein MC885_014254 [Smutsia gigantea]|nr:hypothetical protein MC885_014254 [Smutsia gigantea]
MPRRRKRRASSGGQRMTRSRTARAELLFPVDQVERALREHHYFQGMSSSTSVFVAAVIQDLMAKILELAGNEAQKRGSRRITPEILDMVLHRNPLFSSFFRDTTFSRVAPAGQ